MHREQITNTKTVSKKMAKSFKLIKYYKNSSIDLASRGEVAGAITRLKESNSETYVQLWEVDENGDGIMLSQYVNGLQVANISNEIGRARLIK